MRSIGRSVTKVGVTKTITAGIFATAIIIRNDVILAVMGVSAGTDPDYR
jgi:hypothetical protein